MGVAAFRPAGASLRTAPAVLAIVYVAEVSLAQRLDRQFHASGYVVEMHVARNGLMPELSRLDPDVVLVVCAEPRAALRLCSDIRSTVESRIVVATAREWSESDVITVLDAGGDDVLGPAVSPAVLEARIRVAGRGRSTRWRTPTRLEIGDVTIDLRAHLVSVGAHTTNVPRLQFELLTALASAPGEIVSREALMKLVWGLGPEFASGRRLTIAISHVRALLGSGPNRPTIELIPRLGYRLSIP